ncbi:MAG: tRNA lysidine(34) synthetase TilS [Clostridia bacterium]|nr:tRNA lysidine(34) synthetase TilS [Clostridia bacterium]
MISKALNTIKKHQMLFDAKKVVVGFSGGADSTALLHFLHYFVSEKGKKFQVLAVHVNHNLRGEESKRDEDFVRGFCKKHGINLAVKQADIKKNSKESKIGLEEAGREVRYQIFNEYAKNEKIKIATAHTLSDSVETMILNLIRGSGLKGLCGIPPVRGKIIRPLLDVSRGEIEKYCKENGLSYIHDSTNFEKNYTRNKIRLEIIEYLKKINPAFEFSVGRTIEILRNEENYLEKVANESLKAVKLSGGYDAKKINSLDTAIKNRVVFKIINNFTGKNPENKHIESVLNIIKKEKKEADLPNNTKLICENGILRIKNKKLKKKINWEYPIKNINSLTEIKTDIIINILSKCDYDKIKNKKSAALDYDKLPKGSVLRNRRPGDKFRLPVRKVTKSLKKLFNELKIPEDIRDKIPVIAYKNEVIWIDKIGTSEDYIPDENTNKIAVIARS